MQDLPDQELIELRKWALKRAIGVARDFDLSGASILGTAKDVENYLIAGSPFSVGGVDSSISKVGHSPLSVLPPAINSLRDLVDEVEDLFLIQRAEDDFLLAEDGRRAINSLVKLFNEVFPRSSSHNETPVSCLDTETVAKPGADSSTASGEG